MFKPNSKYRLHYLIVTVVLLIMVTVFNFYDFYEKKDGMKMIGGIVFGLMTIFQVEELYVFIRNKNAEKVK